MCGIRLTAGTTRVQIGNVDVQWVAEFILKRGHSVQS